MFWLYLMYYLNIVFAVLNGLMFVLTMHSFPMNLLSLFIAVLNGLAAKEMKFLIEVQDGNRP